jgi:MFS family permease
VNDLAPDHLRGRYNGAFSLAWTGGYMVGPAIAGFALAAGHPTALILSFVAGYVLAALAALELERRLPPEANRVGEAEAEAVDVAPVELAHASAE